MSTIVVLRGEQARFQVSKYASNRSGIQHKGINLSSFAFDVAAFSVPERHSQDADMGFHSAAMMTCQDGVVSAYDVRRQVQGRGIEKSVLSELLKECPDLTIPISIDEEDWVIAALNCGCAVTTMTKMGTVTLARTPEHRILDDMIAFAEQSGVSIVAEKLKEFAQEMNSPPPKPAKRKQPPPEPAKRKQPPPEPAKRKQPPPKPAKRKQSLPPAKQSPSKRSNSTFIPPPRGRDAHARKWKSRKSVEDLKKPLLDVPYGWTVKQGKRPQDKLYISPLGKWKFRSLKSLHNFLDSLEEQDKDKVAQNEEVLLAEDEEEEVLLAEDEEDEVLLAEDEEDDISIKKFVQKRDLELVVSNVICDELSQKITLEMARELAAETTATEHNLKIMANVATAEAERVQATDSARKIAQCNVDKAQAELDHMVNLVMLDADAVTEDDVNRKESHLEELKEVLRKEIEQEEQEDKSDVITPVAAAAEALLQQLQQRNEQPQDSCHTDASDDEEEEEEEEKEDCGRMDAINLAEREQIGRILLAVDQQDSIVDKYGAITTGYFPKKKIIPSFQYKKLEDMDDDEDMQYDSAYVGDKSYRRGCSVFLWVQSGATCDVGVIQYFIERRKPTKHKFYVAVHRYTRESPDSLKLCFLKNDTIPASRIMGPCDLTWDDSHASISP